MYGTVEVTVKLFFNCDLDEEQVREVVNDFVTGETNKLLCEAELVSFDPIESPE